jgi:hypothetical protein
MRLGPDRVGAGLWDLRYLLRLRLSHLTDDPVDVDVDVVSGWVGEWLCTGTQWIGVTDA